MYRYSRTREVVESASSAPSPPPSPRPEETVWDEPTRASQVVESLAEIEAELWRERQAGSTPPPIPGMTPPTVFVADAEAVPAAVHDSPTAPNPTGPEPQPEPGPDASLTEAERAVVRPAWRWGWLVAAAVALLVAAAAGLTHDGVTALGRRAPGAHRAP